MVANLGEFFGFCLLLFFFLSSSIFVEHSQELSQRNNDIFCHIFPSLRGERYFLSQCCGVVAANTSLYSVAVRNIFQKQCPGRGLLALRYPEYAAVVSKHIRTTCNQFRQYSSPVVVGLPQIVLGTIEKYVLSC